MKYCQNSKEKMKDKIILDIVDQMKESKRFRDEQDLKRIFDKQGGTKQDAGLMSRRAFKEIILDERFFLDEIDI
jgi:hypothetical protein